MSQLLEMPRKPRLFRLDDRVLDLLDSLASDAGSNTNQFVEGLLFEFLQRAGKLPKDATPLPDGRGGYKPGSGRPKKQSDIEQDSEVKNVISSDIQVDDDTDLNP